MKTEPNSSEDESSVYDPMGFGFSQSYEGMAVAVNENPDSELSLLGRTLLNIAKSYQDQFIAQHNLAGGSIHSVYEGPGSMGVYYETVDEAFPFHSAWDGFPGYHYYQEITNPVAEEDNSERTRDFLGEMERTNAAVQGQDLNLQLGLPQHIVITDPVVKREAKNEEEAVATKEELDLNLKL